MTLFTDCNRVSNTSQDRVQNWLFGFVGEFAHADVVARAPSWCSKIFFLKESPEVTHRSDLFTPGLVTVMSLMWHPWFPSLHSLMCFERLSFSRFMCAYLFSLNLNVLNLCSRDYKELVSTFDGSIRDHTRHYHDFSSCIKDTISWKIRCKNEMFEPHVYHLSCLCLYDQSSTCTVCQLLSVSSDCTLNLHLNVSAVFKAAASAGDGMAQWTL